MEAKEKLAKKTAADAKKKEKAAAKVPCDNAATSVDWSCPFLPWQAHFSISWTAISCHLANTFQNEWIGKMQCCLKDVVLLQLLVNMQERETA